MFWDSLLMSKFIFSIRLFLINLAYLCGTMFRWKHTLTATDTPLITDVFQRPLYNYTMPQNLVFTARTVSYIRRGVRRGTLNFWYTQSPIHYDSDLNISSEVAYLVGLLIYPRYDFLLIDYA